MFEGLVVVLGVEERDGGAGEEVVAMGCAVAAVAAAAVRSARRVSVAVPRQAVLLRVMDRLTGVYVWFVSLLACIAEVESGGVLLKPVCHDCGCACEAFWCEVGNMAIYGKFTGEDVVLTVEMACEVIHLVWGRRTYPRR